MQSPGRARRRACAIVLWWPPGGQGTVLPLHTRRTRGRASAGPPGTVASRAAVERTRARREVIMAAPSHDARSDVNGAGRDNRLFFQLLTCCRRTTPGGACDPGRTRRPLEATLRQTENLADMRSGSVLPRPGAAPKPRRPSG